MTTRELIKCYRRTSGEYARREDERHARWWGERIGHEPVSALTTNLITTQLDRLGNHGRSPSTACFYLRFLRRVTVWATLMSYLPADPCAGMDLPKERTPRPRVLTKTRKHGCAQPWGRPMPCG